MLQGTRADVVRGDECDRRQAAYEAAGIPCRLAELEQDFLGVLLARWGTAADTLPRLPLLLLPSRPPTHQPSPTFPARRPAAEPCLLPSRAARAAALGASVCGLSRTAMPCCR